MAFVLHFPIFFTIPFLLEHVDTYLIVYRRLEVIESLMRPEEEAVFLKRQNLIFSVAARSILFVFYFRLTLLEVRFKFSVTYWNRGVGGELGDGELDILF